jgi:hypothetical protein
LLARTYAVLPPVAGNEVAARIADGGRAEFLDEFDHVQPEAVFIGRRMSRFVDSVIDAASQVLYERPEDAAVHRRDDGRTVDHYGRGGYSGEVVCGDWCDGHGFS